MLTATCGARICMGMRASHLLTAAVTGTRVIVKTTSAQANSPPRVVLASDSANGLTRKRSDVAPRPINVRPLAVSGDDRDAAVSYPSSTNGDGTRA